MDKSYALHSLCSAAPTPPPGHTEDTPSARGVHNQISLKGTERNTRSAPSNLSRSPGIIGPHGMGDVWPKWHILCLNPLRQTFWLVEDRRQKSQRCALATASGASESVGSSGGPLAPSSCGGLRKIVVQEPLCDQAAFSDRGGGHHPPSDGVRNGGGGLGGSTEPRERGVKKNQDIFIEQGPLRHDPETNHRGLQRDRK